MTEIAERASLELARLACQVSLRALLAKTSPFHAPFISLPFTSPNDDFLAFSYKKSCTLGSDFLAYVIFFFSLQALSAYIYMFKRM